MIKLGITGHQDLSPNAQRYCAYRFRIILDNLDDPVVGISSLAAGADQIFAHEVLSAGALLWVVKPSVDYESTLVGEDLERYRAMSGRASRVESLAFQSAGEDAYQAAGEWIVDHCDRLLAVWDGQPARGLGGTGDVVKYAISVDRNVEIVWPEGEVRK